MPYRDKKGRFTSKVMKNPYRFEEMVFNCTLSLLLLLTSLSFIIAGVLSQQGPGFISFIYITGIWLSWNI